MHSVKTLVAFVATIAVASAVAGCGNTGVSTVYVTAPPSTVTETVLVTSHSRHSLKSSTKSTLPSVQASSVMSTITHLVTSTDVITLVQPTLGGNGLEQFSFVEQNGDTMWLEGKTPPSSLTYAVMTSNIRIQPLPSTAIVPQKDEVIPSDSVTTAKKAYTGHGSAGWNATTFSTVIGSSPALKSTASAIEKDMLLTDSASLKSYPTTFATRRVKARDVGDMVFAKINGVMVSWANLYDGSSPVTSALSILEPSHSAQTLAIYPWDAPVEASSPLSTSLSQGPSVTLAPYLWEHRSNPSAIPSSAAVPTSKPFHNSTTAVSSAEITRCTSGSNAEFTINFDDLPHFSMSSDPDHTEIPPIFNPYRKLFWQDQFGYVPPPSDPFPPKSPPQLAVYRTHGLGAQGSPNAGLELSGEVGSGPRASSSAYWFDANAVWFGCSDGSHVHCIVTINGYTNGSSTRTMSYTTALDPCFGLKGCTLTHIEFPDEFRSLSGLQFIATIAGEVVDYYMDDLHLTWSNQTCEAEGERSSAE